ncbi:MAG TPA: glucose 1-dehydrogenase [Acidimicrobiales bacterium]|jgi:NAD(P)-dependent dehydrogenase (short-subunit alcohol dehydrogenase family)|nr:glucose 1-dehydrogenase [Acidimicrobiales bacterium]
MGRVEGKVAIVTGAASGIGRAAALLLAREGAAVAVTDVQDEAGHDTVKAIASEGGEARYWHLDTSDEHEVAQVFGEVVDTYDHLDVLVNNAGISGVNKPTHEIALEEWNRVISINLTGVFLCTKHAIPHLRRNGGGSIVNLSSIYGLIGAPDAPPYHAAKGGVRLMSKTDALLYAADNIRVNSVHPGFIWTPMVEHFLAEQGDVEQGRQAIDALHPIGHMGEPDDIAYGILYLASDESKFVTGSELVIDGGYTAR